MTYSTKIRFNRNQSEPPSTDMPSGIFLSPSRHIWVSHSKKSRSKPCFLMNLLAIINNANYKFIFVGYKRHPSVRLARVLSVLGTISHQRDHTAALTERYLSRGTWWNSYLCIWTGRPPADHWSWGDIEKMLEGKPENNWWRERVTESLLIRLMSHSVNERGAPGILGESKLTYRARFSPWCQLPGFTACRNALPERL